MNNRMCCFLPYRNLRILSRATFNFYSTWSGRGMGEAHASFLLKKVKILILSTRILRLRVAASVFLCYNRCVEEKESALFVIIKSGADNNVMIYVYRYSGYINDSVVVLK